MMIAGCGSASISGAKASPISVTGATGAVSSLAISGTAKLSMMPSGDKVNAGVDWVVTCGGNPVTGSISNGACGTLAPVHTADGAATLYTAPSVVPIGATITITATVTSNPSQSTSTSLTILALPIAVSFNNPVPASLEVNGTLSSLQANVTNDPAGAGVIWTATCGSSACGSFNPVSTQSGLATTYTAPATVPVGGTVTVTATSLTDTTKSATATLTITSPSAGNPITIAVSPASFYIQTTGAAHTTKLTASVTNDIAAAGVDWSLTCAAASCGQLTPAHTASGIAVSYIGPSTVPSGGGTVTITAKSTSSPAISASAIATVITTAPIIVSMSTPPPATLVTSSTAVLSATVAPNTGNLGVNWTAACGTAGACGTFNLSPANTASGGQITYTAPAAIPAGGVVTITASSPTTTPSNPAIATTTIVVQPPSLSFAQSPPSALIAGTQTNVSAVVTNDVAPGGVTWTVQCNSSVVGGCGAIVPYQTASGGVATYTAPPVAASGTAVTINATSTADPDVSISSNPIVINLSMTLSPSFIPSPPSQVQADATVNLAAAVANDLSNAGVDWKVCASGCGFFTTQAAIPAIPATTTTPYVPAVPAVTATTVSAWPNNLPLTYTAPSQPPSSGSVVVQIAAHASPATANSATIEITPGANGPGIHGVVEAGMQPVVGAFVALYAAGTGGYGSASSQIFTPGGPSTVATDKNGNFTVPAGYNCPQPNSQMYLVATGGQVGTNAANPNLTLMTALGSCSSLSSASVVLNEVTTIASAFAIAPFASNDALTGNSSYLYLGTSSGNVTGLVNAFEAVNNLVDISTGQVRFTVPAGNAAVPYVEINTLADILNSCTSTLGGVEGDGSACGSLFTATDVLGNQGNHTTFSGSIAPSDTLQAAFNIAQHPVSNYGYQLDSPPVLLSLATLASPFQPILTAQPSDWSISLNYTGGGGLSTASTVGSFAIDAADNLWITDTKAGTVIEWNAVGAALSPSTGFPAGGGPIAIDATGNIWISGNGTLTELTSLGSPIPGSPFGGVSSGGGDIAIDAQSNLWITNSGGVNEFNSLGQEISPSGGYTNDGVVGITAVGIDSSNNTWVGNTVGGDIFAFAELTNPGGQLITNAQGQGGTVAPEIAADGAGDIWAAVPTGFVCELPPYGGKETTLLPNCQTGGGPPNGILIQNPQGIALDGAGVVWVASQGGGVVPPSVLPIAPGLLGGLNAFASSSLAVGTLRVAVDGSGNIWVLLANNTVTEYVGAATPVVTPIALGVKNRKLGAKP